MFTTFNTTIGPVIVLNGIVDSADGHGLKQDHVVIKIQNICTNIQVECRAFCRAQSIGGFLVIFPCKPFNCQTAALFVR